MFTLEQLKCFVTVAEELHFGKAAERLQMTQPPLSRQIQKLERTLGFDLLIRNNRQVVLTPAGEAFLHEAKRITKLVQDAPNQAKKIAAGESGKISIGFTATTALSMLPPLLNLIESKLPEVEIEIHELVTMDQISKIMSEDLDIGLVRELPIRSEIQGQLIHQENLVAAIPEQHPLAAKKVRISPQSFANQQLISYAEQGAAFFNNLSKRVLAQVQTSQTLSTTQIHSMLALVSANKGLALVPESAIRFNIAGVVFKEIEGWEHRVVELFAIWRKDNSNPTLRQVLQILPELASVSIPK